MRALLESLPQPKYLVTNCREKEALQALEALGLGGVFKGVFGADAMGALAPLAPSSRAPPADG